MLTAKEIAFTEVDNELPNTISFLRFTIKLLEKFFGTLLLGTNDDLKKFRKYFSFFAFSYIFKGLGK